MIERIEEFRIKPIEVFPTLANSTQFESDKNNEYYEMEVFEDYIEIFIDPMN